MESDKRPRRVDQRTSIVYGELSEGSRFLGLFAQLAGTKNPDSWKPRTVVKRRERTKNDSKESINKNH